MTRINFFTGELVAKRLEILHGSLPKAARDPCSSIRPILRLLRQRKRLGSGCWCNRACTSKSLKPSPAVRIDAGLRNTRARAPDALFVASDTLFTSRRIRVVISVTRHGIPTTFSKSRLTERRPG